MWGCNNPDRVEVKKKISVFNIVAPVMNEIQPVSCNTMESCVHDYLSDQLYFFTSLIVLSTQNQV